MPEVTITRRLEFDAGHRIPDHKSKCRNLHGHRYVLEITLAGNIIDRPGASSHGMVMDFSDVKEIAKRELVDQWDHAFLVWREDKVFHEFLSTLPDHRTVVLDSPPTVEHLANEAFRLLAKAYAARYENDLRLEAVTLYETPNCWAVARRTGES